MEFLFLKNGSLGSLLDHSRITLRSFSDLPWSPGITLGSPWDNSGITLGSLWDHAGDHPEITLESPWDHPGITLRSLWDHSRITLGSLWDHSETTMGPLWDHSETTMGLLWDHSFFFFFSFFYFFSFFSLITQFALMWFSPVCMENWTFKELGSGQMKSHGVHFCDFSLLFFSNVLSKNFQMYPMSIF